jgi:mono/diheme cytochrome c family protein
MKRQSLSVCLFTCAFLMMACNGGPNKTNIELVTNMMDQTAIKSQGWNHVNDEVQMRQPAPNTVARGHAPYKYQTDPIAAEKEANPLAGDLSASTLTLGRKYYDIYCALCHGDTGAGEGQVAAKMMVKPRNLIAPDAVAYSDGRIYFAITAGRGVMGSYQSQITDARTRWAVVNYVRSLQKQTK